MKLPKRSFVTSCHASAPVRAFIRKGSDKRIREPVSVGLHARVNIYNQRIMVAVAASGVEPVAVSTGPLGPMLRPAGPSDRHGDVPRRTG